MVYGGDGLLAEPALEDVGAVSGLGEAFADGVDVTGSLGEYETGPLGGGGSGDVGADLVGSALVVGERTEDRLDRGSVVIDHEAGGMDDEATLHERAGRIPARVGLGQGHRAGHRPGCGAGRVLNLMGLAVAHMAYAPRGEEPAPYGPEQTAPAGAPAAARLAAFLGRVV